MGYSGSGLIALALAGTLAGCAGRTSAQADGGTTDGSGTAQSTSEGGAGGTSSTDDDGATSATEDGSGTESNEACIEQQKLVPPHIDYDQNFGTSVAAWDETLVVGSYYDESYVYMRDANGAWNETAILRGEGAKRVSSLVSISGDTIVVIGGEGEMNAWTCYVFVFERSGDDWTRVAEIAPAGGANQAFDYGLALASSDDTIVVGNPGHSEAMSHSGAAYVLERDAGGAWVDSQILTASDPAEQEAFGESAGVSGDTIVVGAHMDSVEDIASGSVYVFTRDDSGAWSEVAKLAPADGTNSHRFGKSVGISGDTVVVGAEGDNDRSGSAYVFERDETGAWDEGTKLTAPDDGEDDEWFGRAVATSGDKVMVGAYWDDDAGAESGSVYVFARDGQAGWTQLAKLIGSDTDAHDYFGSAVAISGSTVVIGADGDEYAAGSAYVFDCP